MYICINSRLLLYNYIYDLFRNDIVSKKEHYIYLLTVSIQIGYVFI